MSRKLHRGKGNFSEMSSSTSELELHKLHTKKLSNTLHSPINRLMNSATNCELSYKEKGDFRCRSHRKPMVFLCNYCIVSGNRGVLKAMVDWDKEKVTSNKTCRHCKIRKLCIEILQSYHANVCRERNIMPNSETSCDNSNKERIKFPQKQISTENKTYNLQKIAVAKDDKIHKIPKRNEDTQKRIHYRLKKMQGRTDAESEMLDKIEVTKVDYPNRATDKSEVKKGYKLDEVPQKIHATNNDKLNKTPEKNGSWSSQSDEELTSNHSSNLGKYKENQRLRQPNKKIPYRGNRTQLLKKFQKGSSLQQKAGMGKNTVTRLEEVGVSDYLRIRLENLDCRNMKLSKCQKLCRICKCKCFWSINRCHHHMSRIHFISNTDQCTTTLRKC